MSCLHLQTAGDADSIVVTLQDLTALREVDRMHNDHLAHISQELRKPLSSIMGAVATLQECLRIMDLSEAAEYYEIISEKSLFMRELLGELIDVECVGTGDPILPSSVPVLGSSPN